jgi:hypothetical protein
LAPLKTSSESLKPIVSAHELRSKPCKRDITPTDSVMGVSGPKDANSLQRQDTVASRTEFGEQASSETTDYEPQQTQVRKSSFIYYFEDISNAPQDAPPLYPHISFPPESLPGPFPHQLALRDPSPPPPPTPPLSSTQRNQLGIKVDPV